MIDNKVWVQQRRRDKTPKFEGLNWQIANWDPQILIACAAAFDGAPVSVRLLSHQVFEIRALTVKKVAKHND